MGGTNDPPERNDDQDDDLKAGEEVSSSFNRFSPKPAALPERVRRKTYN
jgi:hypothetical protein